VFCPCRWRSTLIGPNHHHSAKKATTQAEKVLNLTMKYYDLIEFG
jgi:hypothetical protein